jgi:hypothetical protein
LLLCLENFIDSPEVETFSKPHKTPLKLQSLLLRSLGSTFVGRRSKQLEEEL